MKKTNKIIDQVNKQLTKLKKHFNSIDDYLFDENDFIVLTMDSGRYNYNTGWKYTDLNCSVEDFIENLKY